jgi:hypothetical protein
MIHARRSLIVASCLLSLLLMFLSPAAPLSDGTVLVRVDKLQHTLPPVDLVAQMEVIQEFEHAWLVRMPASVVPRLDEAGVSHDVFEPVPYGEVLFLVSTSNAAELEALKQVGAVWPIDANGSLLVTSDEEVRERVPSHLHLKRLPDRINVTPTFRIAGRSLAVPRATTTGWVRTGSSIPQMVNQVSAQAIADTIMKLESFQTRYASMPSCAAAGSWLFDSFSTLGLFVERDDFTFSSYNTSNIVATLPGRTSPEQVVIVGAHYDSYSTDPARLAPGADDNGSGTAAVLELARVLSRYSFDFTVKFIAFSAEEWGLYGSKHYAQSARSAGQKILGVVNLDMIGYPDRLPEDLDVIVNANSEWLANAFVSATTTYAPMPTLKVVNASLTYSDHAPFWDQGYSALCGIEDANPTNPNYHKPYDTFSTINIDFETAVARASLAAVATLAQPFVSPQPPVNVKVQGQVIGSLFMRARTGYLSWTAVPGAAAYNVYRSTTSHASYQRINRTPVTAASFADRLLPVDGTYYYVVTSVDGNGNEGNYSQEVTLAGTTALR